MLLYKPLIFTGLTDNSTSKNLRTILQISSKIN